MFDKLEYSNIKRLNRLYRMIKEKKNNLVFNN